MSRFLILDIGAGTMDLLYYDDTSGLHYKAVARSPVLTLAEHAARLPGNLLITGCEMGGGAFAQVLRQRAQNAEVIMTRSAAFTLHHDLEKVESWGIRVVDDDAADTLRDSSRYSDLVLADLQADRLRQMVEALGVPFGFDVVGVCAQDHGTAPRGVSHLDFRHNIFRAQIDQTPYPHALLYQDHEIPETFNRLRSIATSARQLPSAEIYLMDSGMAAILGASLDPHAIRKSKIIVLDVATSHTLCAALDAGAIAGMFEYHTQAISRILAEGGHGAYVRKALGMDAVECIVATGPKRHLLAGSHLPMVWGAPLGDNMMTGTVGVLEAIRRRKGLKPLQELS
jgi:uncharacterized protein (DUF1786 family)